MRNQGKRGTAIRSVERIWFQGALVAVVTMLAPGPLRAQIAPAPAPAPVTPIAADPAATQGNSIADITVTATRSNQSLTKTPASVTVLDQTTLDQAGVKRVEDFIALTPGVSVVNDTAEAGDTQVNIRGVNGARDAENSFALVVDGIILPNPAAFNRDYIDLKQIEILKGPQGALYGRNAEAGAIVITTQKPTDTLSGILRQSIESYDTYRTQATVAGPIVPGTLTGRLSADYLTSAGTFTNTYLNSNTVDNSRSFDVSGRLIYTPDADTMIDTKFRVGRLDAAAIRYNALFELPGFAAVNPDFFENVNDHNFAYVNNITPKNTQDTREGSIKLDHDFSWAHLSAYFLGSSIDNTLLSDGTGAPFGFYNRVNRVTNSNVCQNSIDTLVASGFRFPPPQSPALLAAYTPTTCDGYQYQVRNQNDYSSEIRLSSRPGERLSWSVGAYYLHIDRQVGVAIGEDLGLGITKSLYQPQGGGSATAQLYDDAFTTNVYAAFASMDYAIRPDLVASAALRYDVEARDDNNLVPPGDLQPYINLTGGPGPLFPLNSGLVANPGGIPPQHKTYEQPQPRFSIRYSPTARLSVYATYGVGFKSGGFNSAGSAATVANIAALTGSDVKINDSYNKETSDAFEIGLKGNQPGVKLAYQFAGYYTLVHNLQFFEFFSGPRGLLRVDSNVDGVTLAGGEAAAQWQPFHWLELNGGFNFTASAITKNRSRPDTVGNKSPYTPAYTATVGAAVTQPLTETIALIARIDTNFVGPTWFHTVQNQTVPSLFGPADFAKTERAAYSETDLRAGVTNGNYELVFLIRNALNSKVLAEVIPAPEFGGVFASESQRRFYGGEMTLRF